MSTSRVSASAGAGRSGVASSTSFCAAPFADALITVAAIPVASAAPALASDKDAKRVMPVAVLGSTAVDPVLPKAAEVKALSAIGEHKAVVFSPDFMRRGWLIQPLKSQAAVRTPSEFFLRPLLHAEKFPKDRKIVLTPEVEARIAAQEAAGHLVFETSATKSADASP